jgi:choline-glycine betaine transporter
MLEKIVHTIRDQSAIFQLAILSSLAGAREYIMYFSLKNHALSSLIVYSVIFYYPTVYVLRQQIYHR